MEYLVQKWKMWFNMLDMTHHKKIAKTDVTQAETTFASLNHLDEEKRAEVLAAMDKFWNQYIFRGKPGPITEKEFVDNLTKDYKADTKAFVDWVKRLLTDLYDIIDLKHEGSITEEECINGFQAMGHEASEALKFFGSFKPVKGKVPVSLLKQSWLHFLTCEDSTQPDILRDALQTVFQMTEECTTTTKLK